MDGSGNHDLDMVGGVTGADQIWIPMDRQITEHLSYEECVRSQTATRHGIDNTPTFRQMLVIERMAREFFEPLREALAVPIRINSLYRCKELNRRIGGSPQSDHMIEADTAAIDLDDSYSRRTGVTNRDIFLYIQKHLPYYKMIWEYEDVPTAAGERSPRWVHVSYSTSAARNQERRTLYTNGAGYREFRDGDLG